MKAKILIVDDEPDALEVLGFKLREAGSRPLFAKDGARALAAARDERPDLIVLDLDAPGGRRPGGLQDPPARPGDREHPDPHADGPGGGDGPRPRAWSWGPTIT